MTKKKLGKLTYKMLLMTILPLVLLGIVTMSFTAKWFARSMNQEVEAELKSTAKSVLNTYDLLYPGDYSKVGVDAIAIVKGDYVLNTAFEPIDYIKEETGIDITFFYGTMRFLTTIRDENGDRILGTHANNIIIKNVFGNMEEHFYTSVVAGGTEFFAYYCPIFNSDGSIAGMIAALKPSKEVKNLIARSVWPILLLSFIGTLIVGYITIHFTKGIIESIHKQQQFMGRVANGELRDSISPDLLKRNDEFGDMARSTQTMQQSLRTLVEIDYLTQLDNRRSGQNLLKKVYNASKESGSEFTLAIGDIDFFKKFNDTYGHDCGDLVLQSVAHELKKCMAGKGYTIRWGGEEFLLIFNRTTYTQSCETLNTILESIRNTIIEYEGENLSVTMTIGAIPGNTTESVDQLLKQADDLLYNGKNSGRNRLVTL